MFICLTLTSLSLILFCLDTKSGRREAKYLSKLATPTMNRTGEEEGERGEASPPTILPSRRRRMPSPNTRKDRASRSNARSRFLSSVTRMRRRRLGEWPGAKRRAAGAAGAKVEAEVEGAVAEGAAAVGDEGAVVAGAAAVPGVAGVAEEEAVAESRVTLHTCYIFLFLFSEHKCPIRVGISSTTCLPVDFFVHKTVYPSFATVQNLCFGDPVAK
jgi:hypothetical protein